MWSLYNEIRTRDTCGLSECPRGYSFLCELVALLGAGCGLWRISPLLSVATCTIVPLRFTLSASKTVLPNEHLALLLDLERIA